MPRTPIEIGLPYVRQPDDFSLPMRYAYGPDSQRHAGFPSGTVTEHERCQSRLFPGATHRYWVYVPAQYTGSEPTSLMIFLDGQMYLDPEGDVRASVVFDNLISKGEMPVTIGVFVDPGVVASEQSRDNRMNEYDPVDDTYAQFLLTEILPSVQARCTISDDPEQWAICGGSAGACCAFTVAWTRPDRFRKVLSLLGGDDFYEDLIKATPKKPLRIFFQSASRDINWDAAEENWVSISLRIAAAFIEKQYDLRFVLGDGAHNPNHGGAIMPDALRWLWRPATPTE